MPDKDIVSFRGIKIGSYSSVPSICRDGYSLSSSPVPDIETSEVLARVNEYHPLISTDGSYQSEILKNIFNIGLKRSGANSLWITPNSIRHVRYNSLENGDKKSMASQMSSEECTLHRQFAGLTTKKDKEILNFANKYGLLRRHPVHNLVFRERKTGRQVQLGESLLWWREEISDLADCLRLWDMVSLSNRELKDIVLWHRDGIALKLNNSYVHLVSRKNMNLLNRWRSGDSKGPVLYHISLEMDRHLLNALTPRMPDLHNAYYYFSPDSLLSAIWLMFLLEIGGNTRLLRCKICGEYFNTHDPRARFCSTRCRMRNYRNTQKLRVMKKKTKGGK
jgi:hypothetical protein